MLFCHIAVLLFAFGLSGVLHGSEWLMARASTVAELRSMARPQKLGPLFAPIIVALLAFGFALIGMSKDPDKFEFSDPFAWTATVVLVFLFLDGPLLLGRHATAMGKAIASAPDGPVTPELRAMTLIAPSGTCRISTLSPCSELCSTWWPSQAWRSAFSTSLSAPALEP